MAVPTFVDRVTLHVSAGRGGHGVASVHREKFKPLGGPDGGNGGPGGSVILRVDPDVTTLVDYHHSPQPSGRARRSRGRRPPQRCPWRRPGASRAGRHRCLRPPRARPGGSGGPGHRDGRGQRRAGRSRQRRAGQLQAQGAGLRAPRRAGRRARDRAGAEGRRRHRPGWLPQRRQVQPDRGDVARPAEDRRLPVHHPGPQPRRRHGRGHHVHGRRRTRPDRGRKRGPRPRARLPPAHRALRRPGPRRRHGHDGARPQSGRGPRHHRERARTVRRSRGPAAPRRPQQDRRSRRP